VRVERHDNGRAQWVAARREAMPVLRPFVGAALEGWAQSHGRPSRLREVPFPGVPLILNLGSAWTIESDRHDSFVAGLHDAPTVVEGSPTWACIELRLTPLGAHRVRRELRASGAVAARAILGVGIGNMQGKMEMAAAIFRVDEVSTLGGAPVALLHFVSAGVATE